MAELIKVVFSDGDEICYKNPVNTVIAVLRRIGVSRFPEITLENAKKRLVSQAVYPELKKYTKEILPGWYYINRTDTREKTSQLINIKRLLGLDFSIEVGEFSGKKNPVRIGSTRTRPKNKLQVTMPDGDIIDYEGYRDVFMECIYKLGPRLVSSKANFDLSSKCPLLTATDTTGKRKKVADSLYLALPSTAKEAGKILSLIAIRLRLQHNMRIETIRMSDR